QVEEFAENYVEKDLTDEDKEIAEEFIAHARLFKEAKSNEELKKVFNKLGGATVYYRGKLQDSPAYKLNHEELIYALALGVDFKENMQPLRINVDKYGYMESVVFENRNRHCEQSKTAWQSQEFGLTRLPHQCYAFPRNEVKTKTVIMAIGIENNTQFDEDKYSYFGDCNPKYSGSVVKALASTKEGYEAINKRLINVPSFKNSYKDFCTQLDYLLVSRIHKINILDNKTFELIIHSPLAAKNFKFGQFFRLQNYSEDAAKLIEPVALSPTDIDVEKGLIRFVIYEVGKSTSLCKTLSENEKVVLMGPTGSPLEIPQNKKIVIVDSEVGNIGLLKVLKENNNEVIFVSYSDIKIRKLVSVDIVIINASPEIIEELQSLKNEIFSENTKLIVSVNSSMQCMMKGICGQCIQKVKGEQKYIFACSQQNQNAEIIDFKSLKTRLRQNSLQEKVLRHCERS
ncbi:MAG: 2-polyprenylphenol hydroxylase, partial [Rickettsia endosymbiont of Eriopis connexa]|nr:2-polyprenylphenol hydroxylase [Rickettsia endosymbiont of Eriopis connexa]